MSVHVGGQRAARGRVTTAAGKKFQTDDCHSVADGDNYEEWNQDQAQYESTEAQQRLCKAGVSFALQDVDGHDWCEQDQKEWVKDYSQSYLANYFQRVAHPNGLLRIGYLCFAVTIIATLVVGKVCEMVGLGTSVFTTLSTVDVVTEVALVHDAGGFASSLLTRLLVQAGTQGAVRGGDVYSNDLCSLL